MVRYAEPPTTAMGNVVNLGRARKRKREDAEKRRADENAIRHGRTKAEKARERMQQAKLRATVEGARLEPTKHEAETTAHELRPAPAQPAATADERAPAPWPDEPDEPDDP